MAIRALQEVPEGSSIFIDTNILIYHLLDDELYGESCRDFLKRVEMGSVTALTSPIVASETLLIYLRAWVIQNKNRSERRAPVSQTSSSGVERSRLPQAPSAARIVAAASAK
jgi:predicted nucleic acid-binding protein